MATKKPPSKAYPTQEEFHETLSWLFVIGFAETFKREPGESDKPGNPLEKEFNEIVWRIVDDTNKLRVLISESLLIPACIDAVQKAYDQTSKKRLTETQTMELLKQNLKECLGFDVPPETIKHLVRSGNTITGNSTSTQGAAKNARNAVGKLFGAGKIGYSQNNIYNKFLKHRSPEVPRYADIFEKTKSPRPIPQDTAALLRYTFKLLFKFPEKLSEDFISYINQKLSKSR